MGNLVSRRRVRATPVEITDASLRRGLASLLDRVADDREVVILRRRGGKDVALIAADELSGLLETAHLLRSPRNAERLMSSIQGARRGEGKQMSLAQLRRQIGLEES